MSDRLSLKFQGPFGIVPGEAPYLFHDELARTVGIYPWAAPYHRVGFLPLYLGETSASVERRVQDHLIRTNGGYNRISDPDLLLRPSRRAQGPVEWPLAQGYPREVP